MFSLEFFIFEVDNSRITQSGNWIIVGMMDDKRAIVMIDIKVLVTSGFRGSKSYSEVSVLYVQLPTCKHRQNTIGKVSFKLNIQDETYRKRHRKNNTALALLSI